MSRGAAPKAGGAASSRLAAAFPGDFVFGVASSGHQVEGGNIHSDWWRYEQSGVVKRQQKSGRANDYWNLYPQDHALMNTLAVQANCIGIEWARVEPMEGCFDETALDNYRRMVDDMRHRGLRVGLDLNHWILPTWFSDEGAWLHPKALQKWERFLTRVVRRLSDAVDWWMTICEPMVIVLAGYSAGLMPPRKINPFEAARVFKVLLKGHAMAYALVHAEVSKSPTGGPVMVGYANAATPFTHFHPPYTGLGSLEKLLGQGAEWALYQVWDESVKQGRVLPPWGLGEEIEGLKNSLDYVGVNYYSRYRLRLMDPAPPYASVMTPPPGGALTQMGYPFDPAGFYDVLMDYHRRFAGVPLYVTENGCADAGDDLRQKALVSHLWQVHRAMQAGADIRGYFYWTLTDNFEWLEGYDKFFGLVHVDRSTPALTRTPRPSAFLYRDIIRAGGLTQKMVRQYMSV